MAKEMGESSLIGEMIKMPLPNNGFMFYPARFALDAIYNNKFSLFVSKGISDDDASVLAATTKTGARIILIGDYDKLIEQLLDLPWEEDRIKISEGVFYRKIAPSYDSLIKFIEILKNTTQ